MTATLPTTRRTSIPATVWVAAILLPVGPAAIAVLRLLLPYYTAGDTASAVTEVAAHPGRESAVLWLGFIGVLTLVPGLVVAARVCRSAAPRLTAWALALAVPGYLSLGVLLAYDHILWSVVQSGLPVAESVRVVEVTHPSIDVAIGVFVIGHVVGTVLLGLALLRSGRIPAWSAWAITVSQPLHFVATVILGSPQVDFVAWSLTAVGMAAVARTVLRDSARA